MNSTQQWILHLRPKVVWELAIVASGGHPASRGAMDLYMVAVQMKCQTQQRNIEKARVRLQVEDDVE